MVHFVVALSCEARPLIEHFGLSPVPDEVLPTYESDNTILTVCGIGKLNASVAVGWLQGKHGHERPNVWLNVGVCGHRNLDPGTASLAHKVTDHATKNIWNPSIVFDATCDTRNVRTVNVAEREFETEDLYEMEASGFISAALRFSTADLVHCFKIVSDNLSTDLSSLKLSDVEDLVDAHCATISELVRQLTEVRDSLVSQS
ncbi:MAG: hypothetical protein QGF00_17875 [Planctomycetota bacterium]|jgi:nucleoside phosphorylase|nr:hypothetical protein [Planctomycetota bacterium]